MWYTMLTPPPAFTQPGASLTDILGARRARRPPIWRVIHLCDTTRLHPFRPVVTLRAAVIGCLACLSLEVRLLNAYIYIYMCIVSACLFLVGSSLAQMNKHNKKQSSSLFAYICDKQCWHHQGATHQQRLCSSFFCFDVHRTTTSERSATKPYSPPPRSPRCFFSRLNMN